MSDEKRDKTIVASVHPLLAKKPPGEEPELAYLIVIQGTNVGRMYKLATDTTVIGRGLSAHIRIDDDGVSRAHAQLHREPDGRIILTDLGSTNGTFANGATVSTHVLDDGDKVQIGRTTILKFSYHDDIEEAYQRQMYDSATKDGLTGIHNKRFFLDRVGGEFTFSTRHAEPLTLILFDIDHFKLVNDSYGHPAGDFVLREIAQIVSNLVRSEDVFTRYGGEEFSILARGIDPEGGFIVAERSRRAVEEHKFDYDGNVIPVTISAGIATLQNSNFKSVNELVQSADQYLYKAKQGGRNRVASAFVP